MEETVCICVEEAVLRRSETLEKPGLGVKGLPGVGET